MNHGGHSISTGGLEAAPVHSRAVSTLDSVGREGASAPADAPAALPCLYSNNCDKEDGKPTLSPYHRKVAVSLAGNVQTMAQKYGISCLGFLTLTTKDGDEWEEFQGKYHSLNRRLLPELFQAWLTVFEFSARGRLHAHSLVAAKCDIRTGFDFGKYLDSVKPAVPIEETRRLIREAAANCPNLRRHWSTLRARLPEYGFGRHELIPVRSNTDAIARYVGKYVAKCIPHRTSEHRGCRFVRYSQGWRGWSVRFGWATPGGKLWRKKLALLAQGLNLLGYPVRAETYTTDMRRIFGARWAWSLKDIIPLVDVGSYESCSEAVADGVDKSTLLGLPSDATDIKIINAVTGQKLKAMDCAAIALTLASKGRFT